MALEKTDQAVSESVKLFNDFAKQGIEFVQQQSPELCQQIVLRAEVQYFTLFIIFGLISGILFYLSKRWQKYEEKIAEKSIKDLVEYIKPNTVEDLSTYFFTRFVQIVSFLPFFIGCTINLYYFISVYVAPKVYLVEYFTQLIKD